jgi:MFS family permease
MRRIAAASLIGTTIEWYDFFLYATMAALVFNHVFFPALDDSAGTLASFATFGAGFIARPVGGLLMGHFGDRVGRKSAMVTSLLLMGGATFAIGLVPSYDRIGIAAPVMLVVLRFLQGFALGGEWGGAVTLSMEHAPPGRRGWWASWVQYGALGGIVLSSGTVLVLSETLTDRQFVTWGWRVPFLASGLLLAVGLFVRLRIEESPVFTELNSSGDRTRLPAVEALRHHGWTMVRIAGMHLVVTAFATTLMTFYIAYGVRSAGFSRTEMLQVVFLGTLLTALVAPFLGNLSDRFGRRRMYIIGCTGAMAGVYPSFLLVDTGRVLPGIAGILCLVVPLAVTYQVQGAYFPELFPAQARVTGAGLGAQLATVAVGGPAPSISQALLNRGDGRPWLVAAYLCAVAFVSLLSAVLTPDRRPRTAEDPKARWDTARARHRAPAPVPALLSADVTPSTSLPEGGRRRR